jgi:exodeoxyribonuclease V alpha subunit
MISCCAPTGKAAENLSKMIESVSSGGMISAKTVHSLLKIAPSNMHVDEFAEIEADLLIIDECSMIDFTLFSILVKKIKPTTKVLLIGDPEQLPPVKGTSPFSLIISLEKFFPNLAVSRLTIPLRTKQKGLIDLTDGVLLQNFELIQNAFLDPSVEINSLESVFSSIAKLLDSFIQVDASEIDFQNLYDLKILTTHNVGPFGAESINQYCLNLLEKKAQKRSFLLPIIFRENDEKFGIYNGELAYLSYFKEKPMIYLKNKTKLSPTIAPKYDFAFAISIHKSQGSEFSHVLFTIQNISDVTKALIYTAVSRAKKSLKIFGTIDQLIESEEIQSKCEDYCKEICLKIFEESTLKLV